MDSIYSLDNGSKIALYAMEHSVFIHPMPLTAKARPMLICTDYLEMFYSCIHENTIFYVYKNTSHNLILSSLPERRPLIILNDEALLFEPSIIGLYSIPKEALCMPVILKNPLNETFSVDFFLLHPQIKRFPLLEGFSTIPSIHFFVLNMHLYFVIQDAHKEKKPRIFYTNMQGNITEIPSTLTISTPCTHCKELEEKISSITTQYNRLAETARKIQEEGRHWKDLYQSSIF